MQTKAPRRRDHYSLLMAFAALGFGLVLLVVLYRPTPPGRTSVSSVQVGNARTNSQGPPEMLAQPPLPPDLGLKRTRRPPTTASTGLLRVRVVHQDTVQPLAGIRLTLLAATIQPSDEPPESLLTESPHPDNLTDEEGWATIEATAGIECWLLTTPPAASLLQNKKLRIQPLHPGEQRVVRIELPEQEHVWCASIVDGETLLALSGALWAYGKLHELGSTTFMPVDRTGAVCVGVSSSPARFVRIDCPGYWKNIIWPDLGHESHKSAQYVTLWRAASLELTLSSRITNCAPSAIASASRLDLSQLEATNLVQGLQVLGDQRWEAIPESPARLRFENLPPKIKLTIRVNSGNIEDTDLFREQIVLSPGERRVIPVLLAEGTLVTGSMLDSSSNPLSGVEVWLAPRQEVLHHYYDLQDRNRAFVQVSDATGRFTFDSVLPGDWLLGPAPHPPTTGPRSEAAGDVIAPVPVALTVKPEDRIVTMDLVCWKGLHIRGLVFSSAGLPSPATRVWARAGKVWCGAKTDNSGAFKLGPLIPGEYQVRADAKTPFEAPSLQVPAQAGDQGVELRLRAGGTVVVSARGPDGQPVQNIGVELIPQSVDFQGCTVTRSQSGRTFEIGGVPPGTYTVFASNDFLAGYHREFHVTAGTQVEVHISLVSGGKVEVLGPTDVFLLIQSEGHIISVSQLDSGGSAILVLPEGEYEFNVGVWSDTTFRSLDKRRVAVRPGISCQVSFPPTMSTR